MNFICVANNFLSKKEEQFLCDLNISIIHKTKLLPIYIVKGSSSDSLLKTNYFREVRTESIFSLADVTMNPHISNKLLKKKAIVGWGNIKVAVIDSGILPNQLTLVYEKDYTGYSNQIVNHHGTHVGKIIHYYAPGSQILSLKVAHQGKDIQEGHIFMALDEALEQNVDIINMSIGATRRCDGSCSLCDYINAVVNEGVTVVTASGNSGHNSGHTIDCPGVAEKAITVGAIDNKRKVAGTSGKGLPGMNKPNLLAPGIVSVKMKNNTGETIEDNSGTSFAAPVVTGVLASLYSVSNQKSGVVTKLYDSCQPIIGVPKHHQGFGVINLKRLLEVCEYDTTISNPSSGQEKNSIS